jgi:Cd2+/Zn2+-exporting ATPase
MQTPEDSEPRTAQYRVSGMDCASCVAKIETAAREVPGVVSIKVSIASQLMGGGVDSAHARQMVCPAVTAESSDSAPMIITPFDYIAL